MKHALRHDLRYLVQLLLLAPLTAWAQPPCDTIDQIDFTVTPIYGTNYQFHVYVSQGNAQLLSVPHPQWQFVIDGEIHGDSGPTVQDSFPHQSLQSYLVGVGALLYDTQTQSTCAAVHVEEVPIGPYYPNCHDSLQPAFTIEANGQTIVFLSQSVSTAAITSYRWDFGDGTAPVQGTFASISHTYDGSGPYPVELTISTSDSCFASVINWIYLGPNNVPCDQLLQPDIRHAEIELTTACYDASISSGMNYETQWSFGDGAFATGRAVFHTYEQAGFYEVTASAMLWGPLAVDTCHSSSTFTVMVAEGVTAGIADQVAPTLSAYPQPFTDHVTISGLAARNARWELLDLTGRVLHNGVVPTSGPFLIDGSGLRTGLYVLRTIAGAQVSTLRLIKQ